MPSGQVHDKLTLVTAAASVPIWILLVPDHNPELYVAGIAAYVFSGYLLSDDLDTDSLCYRRWGLLRFLWWPYRTFVPHRSWLSHGLIIGPLFRVVYFCTVAALTARCVQAVSNKYFLVVDKTGILRHTRLSLTDWIIHDPGVIIVACIGLVLGGLTHSLADNWTSFWKKVW